jgi:small GTP-binding protein
MFSWLIGTSTSSSQLPQVPPATGINNTNEEFPKIRILVLGDSGTGKTCFIERLVNGKPPTHQPRWTLGCDVSCMVHTILLNNLEKKILIEFWDVGGHRNYADSRGVFYHQINGILLVHDSTNRKSFQHLKNWLEELEKEDQMRKSRGLIGIEEPRFGVVGKREIYSGDHQHLRGGSIGGQSYYSRRPAAAATQTIVGPLEGLPILVVGNKCDLGRANVAPPKLLGYDSILTSAMSPSRDGRLIEHEKLVGFFQKVFERRYG